MVKEQTLSEKELSTIDCVLFATETGVDFSKAASVIVHELLNLPSRARAVEIKQACYAGTFGLHTALAMLATGVHKNVYRIFCLAVKVVHIEIEKSKFILLHYQFSHICQFLMHF